MKGTMYCNECSRIHTNDQPCSQRVTNAYFMRPQALEHLTEADKKWMHGNLIDCSDIVEKEIADRIGKR